MAPRSFRHRSRHCPECDEIISPRARICHYCRSAIRDPGESQIFSNWLRSHPTLTVSLATFLYVAFRVYEAADFDVNNMLRILHANGLSTILVGVLLVQLPAELLLLTLAACWWLYSAASDAAVTSPSSRRVRHFVAGSRTLPLLLLAILIALSYTIIPWLFFLASLFVIAITIVASYRVMMSKHDHAPPTATTAPTRSRSIVTLRRSFLLIGLAVLFYAISGPAIWVDAENITTTDRGNIVGYVIDDSGPWTTILTPTWTGYLHQGNSVTMEKTDHIVKRQLCAITIPQPSIFGIKTYRPIQIWRAWITHRPVPILTSRCPFSNRTRPR